MKPAVLLEKMVVEDWPAELPAIELIRSRRRSLELRVFPDGRIQVRAPLRCPQRDITSFVSSRKDWLLSQWQHSQQRQVIPAPTFTSGESHQLLGRYLPLVLIDSRASGVRISSAGIEVSGPDLGPGPVAGKLERWYRHQARQIYQQLIDRHFPWFEQRGHARPALTIRLMKSRWGSLSVRSGMSLNLALVRTPLELIEYVVVHELCHLEHANHGAGFKALMDDRMPDWRQRRAQLNAFPVQAFA